MSRLTAMDIEKQEFSRKLRGCDAEEVQLYLKSVAEEVERMTLENGQMQEEVGRLRSQLREFQSREKTLQQTLVSAQQMAHDLKEKAQAEAELIVEQARLRGEQMLHKAQEELSRLDGDITRSRFERESLEQRLRSVLDQHLALLDMRKEAHGELNNLRMIQPRLGSETG